ncbi:hypothetical protein [Salinarimonas soli]|uniref:Chemotaxis protein n=1 Tax=Salinarimonas soli TaxID=1638099 RepID=A0A5B2V7C4_9HYPH|nr:hypothetical protein [Salinarimonas soli]KAA2234696.1 hypothetical protein F0L46_23310 [Salinarimonas soli]
MIYTALDVGLVAMLALVTVYAAVLHRELRRFRGANAEYIAVLAQTSRAVESVEGAVRGIQDDAGSVLVALGEQIDRANMLLGALKDEHRARAAAPAPEARTDTRSAPRPEPKPEVKAAARVAAALPKAAPLPEPAPARKVTAWTPERAAPAAAREPEPAPAAPVRAAKAHQWPTVRLASGATPA